MAAISLGLTLVAVISGGPRNSPAALIPKRSVTDEPSVAAGMFQQVARCSRSACQFPTFVLPALHERAPSAGGALAERCLRTSSRSTSRWIGAVRKRCERGMLIARPGTVEVNGCEAAADGLIALGLPMSEGRAAGLIELGLPRSDGAALGFAPSG